MDPPIEYDKAWKEAIELYLQPFLSLCFPRVAADIDWSEPPHFLDTELQEAVRDAELGRQRVDKLVQVRRRNGAVEQVLIHVEVQAQPDKNLPLRLYQYNHRIVDRFGHPAATLAVLADERPSWRPGFYVSELWGCRVRFEFLTCKLLDFRWESAPLEDRGNPVAMVVAAHLASQALRGDTESRKLFKWQLLRRLYSGGYSRKDIIELMRLIDCLLVLPREINIELRKQLFRTEEDTSMPLLSTFEQMALEEGLQKGLEQGIEQGREQQAGNMLVRQCRKRFPAFNSDDEVAIRALSLERLDALSDALLDFTGIEEFRAWIGQS